MSHEKYDVDVTKTEGVHYVGEHRGFQVFHYLADGDGDGGNSRPVLEILVNGNNEIFVASMRDGDPVIHPTKGVAHRHVDAELQEAGVDTEYVCLGSVMSYVVPRIATLMARVYCPQV